MARRPASPDLRDCRDRNVVHRLFEGAKANLVITSPPYATQREYDPESGFTPVPPEEYVGWFRVVAANIAQVLAPDGSYFRNIKEHADGGQRSLYVKDLLIAHVRQFGWWFIDELCWWKTDNGVPGGWGNRFKNAWEPVFHFSAPEARIKFRPTAVGHVSDDCFDYSPSNPKSTSGSGLLGTRCTRIGRGEGWRRGQRWTLCRHRAAEQRYRSQVREQPGVAFRTVPAPAAGILPEGVLRPRRRGFRSVRRQREHYRRGSGIGPRGLRDRDQPGVW
jgi:hypothetical protein